MEAGSIGFIGLGRMGSGMARNLMKAVGSLVVYDAVPSAAGKLEEHGADRLRQPG